MSSTTEQSRLPFIITQPREVELLDGMTELSSDVRLSTSNVIPYMRKTMRSIFTSAAIRVVANKKRFVIQVDIIAPEAARWADVPEHLRIDYYQMDILDNVVTIASPSQVGAIWGVQTFADLFQAGGPDTLIPNCRIRDWSTVPVRGLFLPAIRLGERMRLDDYGTIIDRMARVKMNTLVIQLYARIANQDGDGTPDILMVPFPDHPQLATRNHVLWETPVPTPLPDGAQDSVTPVIVSEDCYAGVVEYGLERGVRVVPGLDLVAATPLLKQICPTAGQLDDAAFRDCLEQLYGSFLCRYHPDGVGFLHVGLAEVAGTPQLPDYLGWLVETLTAKGVGKVIVDASALSAAAIAQLAKLGLQDRVVAHGEGAAAGPAVWVAVAAGCSNWRQFGQIDDQLRLPKNELDGVLCTTMIDSIWVFDEHLVGAQGWRPEGAEDLARCRQRAMTNLSGKFAEPFLAAMPAFARMMANLPACFCKVPANRLDQGAAFVDQLAAELGPQALERLDELAANATTAFQVWLPLVTTEGESTPFPAVSKTYIGECARVAGLAKGCRKVLEFRQSGDPEALTQGIEAITEGMQGVASYKPRFMSPLLLSGLTMVRNYIKSLQ